MVLDPLHYRQPRRRKDPIDYNGIGGAPLLSVMQWILHCPSISVPERKGITVVWPSPKTLCRTFHEKLFSVQSW